MFMTMFVKENNCLLKEKPHFLILLHLNYLSVDNYDLLLKPDSQNVRMLY